MPDLNNLYTLGYTGRKASEIVQIARGLGAVIVDIRMVPESRVYQWHGFALRSMLEIEGLRYEWVQDLGNVNYRTGGPIQIRDIFAGALRLRGILMDSRAIILCACERYEGCHRAVVAEHMQISYGVRVQHIGGEAPNVENADQLSLF